jgi:hypothetical protein
MLIVVTWAGGWRGEHLKWMGFTEEAEAFRERNKWGIKDAVRPGRWFKIVKFWIVNYLEPFKIAVGKYRVDANGNPIRWIPLPVKKKAAKQTVES